MHVSCFFLMCFLLYNLKESADFLEKYAAPPLPFFTVSLIESALENSLYRGITVKKFGDLENETCQKDSYLQCLQYDPVSGKADTGNRTRVEGSC